MYAQCSYQPSIQWLHNGAQKIMTPSLIIGGIPFYDAPSKIEGPPYWVDLWADVNGYKIGL